MAMAALKIGAPEDYLQLLKEHTEMVNLPQIGIDENITFPAVQANIASAIAWKDALGIYPYYLYTTFKYSYYVR